MKTRNLLAALAASLLLTGCFQDVHELDLSKNVGYVAPALQWANPADAGTDIHDLLVVVNSAEGSSTRHYSNVVDFAREPLVVPAGDAGILLLANATEADGIQVSGLPATKFTMAEMLVQASLISVLAGRMSPFSSPFVVGYSQASVEQDAMCSPVVDLQHVMPSLSLNMSNIPENTSVQVKIENMARAVILSGADGSAVSPSAEALDPFSLKTLSAADNRVSGTIHPTVGGATDCRISLTITESGAATSGIRTQRAGDASHTVKVTLPRLDCGNNYNLAIDYMDVVHVLSVGSLTIDSWDVEEPYTGRVYE